MSSVLNIAIPAGTVSGALSSFPATMYVNAGNGMEPIFSSIGSNWDKLYIYDSSNVSLPISVLRWDAANQDAQITVLISVPTPSSDTTFRIVFGNDLSSNPLIGAEGTATGSAAYDTGTIITLSACQDPSTGGACILDGKALYHGTPNGTMTSGDLVTHGAGKGLELDGVDDWISLPTISGLSSWTMAATVTPTDTTSGDGILVINGEGLVFSNGYFAGLHGNDVIKRGNTVVNGTRVRLLVTWNGSVMNVYQNGVDVSVALSNTKWGLSGAYRVGSGYLARKPGMVCSALSAANTVRSTAWIAADTLSVNDALFANAEIPPVITFEIASEPDEVSVQITTGLLLFSVDSPLDEVSATFSTPIICSFVVEAPSDNVSLLAYGEDSGELDFNVDARADTVSARFVNSANLFVIDQPVDEVSMSIVAPSVLRVAARGYHDVINASFSTGRTEIGFAVQGYADSVQLAAIVPSVLRFGVSSVDEVSLLAEVEQRIVGSFKVDCPADSVSASFIAHEPIRFSIDSQRDDVSLKFFHVPVMSIGIGDNTDQVSVRFLNIPDAMNLSFDRDDQGNGALVDAPVADALRFSRNIASTGTTPPSSTVPIHFSR